MRDPIEELENFTVPGTPMTPLPAAEVRRRGDRIRRRNNVLVGAAAVAVVAAIVTPVAMLADRDDARSVDPAPATDWVQKVPDGFPLSTGLFSEPPVTAQSGADDIVLCGTAAWSPTDPVATVDLAGARYAENEAHMGRTLALYPDAKAAEAAMSAIRSGVQDCPRDENGGGLPLVNELGSLDLSGDEWVTVVQQAENDGGFSDLTVWEVVRYGNALFVDTLFGSAGGEDAVTGSTGLLAGRSEGVRSQLCVFSAEPCATPPAIPEDSADPDPDPGTGEGAVSAIPSGLQLGRGLSSSEGEPVDGPSATAEGVPALDLCGTSVWPVTGVERLAVTVSGPEYRENRELVTFASSADLTAALDALRSAADPSCAPEGRTMASYDEQVGDNSVTFAMGYEGGTGLDIYQFAQVGRSLLATHRMTDGFLDGADPSVRNVTKANQDLVPDLCPFTERGC
jgi:hypothetical protein